LLWAKNSRLVPMASQATSNASGQVLKRALTRFGHPSKALISEGFTYGHSRASDEQANGSSPRSIRFILLYYRPIGQCILSIKI
ncbi:hypothetical protein AMTR_s00101p00163860, partial [Amborella trichopoda]